MASAYLFLDLGTSNLLAPMASNLFGRANNDFDSLVKWSKNYFLKISVFFLLLIPVGFIYFSKNTWSVEEIKWQIPWLILIASVSMSILANAYIFIIEGMGNVRIVYKLRIYILTISSISIWGLIIKNKLLFTPLVPYLVSSLFIYPYIFLKFKFLIFPVTKGIDNYTGSKWFSDFSQLHKKVRLSWSANWLFLSCPTIIIFYLLGPIAAGKFGLSIVFMNMIGVISSSAIASKIVQFGRYISRGKILISKKIFIFEFKKALVLNIFGYIFLIGISKIYFNNSYVERFLEPLDLFLLAICCIFNQSIGLINIYFRSHVLEMNAEEYLLASISGLLLSLLLAPSFGITGVLIAITSCYIIFLFSPLVKTYKLMTG